MRASWFAASFALIAGACATKPSVPDEALATPFVLEQSLAGRSVARGEFRTITGARRGFTATLEGSLQGDVFVLTEDFVFDDGQRDRKTWRLTRVSPGVYEGVREDVIGSARGYQDGAAFRLEYDVRLQKPDGSFGPKVRFRDVLAEGPNGVVLNRANVGYWGLRVARVELEITPER